MSFPSIRVYVSRHAPGLKPGMGDCVLWDIGETVEIISGIDKGRMFVITTKHMIHPDAPGMYVRDGYFVDEPGVTWAKREEEFWFPNEVITA